MWSNTVADSHCKRRKRLIRERTLSGVRYREIPGYADYLAGEDGTIWKGDIESPQAEWFRPVVHSQPGSSSLRVWVSKTEAGQTGRRIGELVLLAFGPKPPADPIYVGYRDGDASNLSATNLFWSTRRLRYRKPQPRKKAWVPRGAYVTACSKVIPLIWDQESQEQESHNASQESRSAGPKDHVPD